MSIREINDQYKEYADPYEPVKGKKSHSGIAITSKQRIQAAAQAAAASILTMAVLTTVILNVFFHLSAQVSPQSATAHEAEFSYAVDTSDFAEAGVYYTLTDPNGIVIASAPISDMQNTLRFTDLKENSEYTLTLYDKNGNKLDAAPLTTADDPEPIPRILTLRAQYDRLTETVTIHGQADTDDAPDFTAALSSPDFALDESAVLVSISEDGIADIRYSGVHPLAMGAYDAVLTIGYRSEDTTQEQSQSTQFHAADLVINGFSGSVNSDKSVSLDAIATHHFTESEPYEVQSVTITAKQIFTGKTFDVPATFTVSGDKITVKAATAVLNSGKYRFALEIGYTINGTSAPILRASTDSIDILVPYPIPAPTVTPKPTPVITPTPTPTPTPAYTDLAIDEGATSAHWDMDFYVYSGVIINDAENISGTVSIPDLGLETALTLTDNGDGTMDATGTLPGNTAAPGQYEATITYSYTLNGQARTKTTTRTIQAGSLFIDSVYRSGDSTTMSANTDVLYFYVGPDGPYSITAIRADLYDSAQTLVNSYAGTPPALDPGHTYYDSTSFTALTDTVYYVQWVIDFTIGSGGNAYTGTASSSLLRVDLINPSIATQPPSVHHSASQSGSGAALHFHFTGNAGSSVSNPTVFVNGIDAASAGYTVSSSLAGADGTISVSGPYSGLTEVSISYNYTLANSDYNYSATVNGYLDAGYFAQLQLSDITVTPNGDGTANVTGSIRTSNTAPVTVTNVIAKAVGSDAVEYPGNLDSAPAFDGSSNTGTFTVSGITLPSAGDYTVYLEAMGHPVHGYPYDIIIHGSASVSQSIP